MKYKYNHNKGSLDAISKTKENRYIKQHGTTEKIKVHRN